MTHAHLLVTPCKTCGGPLPPIAAEAADEFCSRECCQAAHGVREQTHQEITSGRFVRKSYWEGRLGRVPK